jgi:phosphate starvation-inducible PhoH-like protein
VERAEVVFDGLVELAENGNHPTPETAERLYRMGVGGSGGKEVLGDVILTHRGPARFRPRPATRRRTPTPSGSTRSSSESGRRGTGKTYLAVALAVDALNRGEVNRIILTRPAVEAGESLGFLPGDVMAEGGPVLQAALRRPVRDDRSGKVSGASRTRHHRDSAAGLYAGTYAQRRVRDPGRGAEHYPAADEDVPDAARLRLQDGDNGDATQVDLPKGNTSGLEDARRTLTGVDGVDFVRLQRDDIVRSDLVMRIVDAYEGARGRPERSRKTNKRVGERGVKEPAGKRGSGRSHHRGAPRGQGDPQRGRSTPIP